MSLARAAVVALSVGVNGAFQESFAFELNGISTSAEFSSDFDVDTFEVSVERYKDSPAPSGGRRLYLQSASRPASSALAVVAA